MMPRSLNLQALNLSVAEKRNKTIYVGEFMLKQ